MDIVRAKRGDCKEISKLRRRAIIGSKKSEYSSCLLKSNSFEGIKEEFISSQVFSLVNNKKIIGNVSLVSNKIDGLYVHPKFFRRGIGRALLNYVELYVINKGINSLYLYSTKDSVGFYFKCGYKPINVAYSFNTIKPLVFIRMEKKLI